MHDNALTAEAKKLFPHFVKFEEFYLVGGTALALQIGHRVSVDFDFFSEEELSSSILPKIKRVFADGSLAITYRSEDQLDVLINNIKTTFLHYPYPLIESPRTYRGVSIAPLSEIAAMKAFSIGRRLAYKDYVDWYFMLKEGHIALDAAVALAQKKYGGEFNDRLFAGQLVSLDEVPGQKIDFLRESPDFATVKEFLTNAVKDFISRKT